VSAVETVCCDSCTEGSRQLILCLVRLMRTTTLAVVALCLCVAAHSRGESIRVSVEVAAPEVAKAEVASSINRELRKLGDVDIADRDVDYQINIVVLQLSASGYVFSVVVLSPFRGVEADPVFKHAVMPLAHFAHSGPLQKVVRSVVAEIDTEVFESSRKAEKMFRQTPTPTPAK
jgi:hypothetical protein